MSNKGRRLVSYQLGSFCVGPDRGEERDDVSYRRDEVTRATREGSTTEGRARRILRTLARLYLMVVVSLRFVYRFKR